MEYCDKWKVKDKVRKGDWYGISMDGTLGLGNFQKREMLGRLQFNRREGESPTS